MSRQFLYGLAALSMLAAPAHATLMISASINGGPAFTCIDNAGPSTTCVGGDVNPAVGTLALAPVTIDGVTLSGSTQISSGTIGRNPPLGGQDSINSSSLQIINTNSSPVTVIAAVGDTDFTPPVSQVEASASGTFQNAVGATIVNSFFDDPANTQGATSPTDTPGNNVFTTPTFTSTVPLNDSFSFNSGLLPVGDTAPFSMTQSVEFTLPGAVGGVDPQLVSRGQSEIKLISGTAVPEPPTLALLGGSLLLLGLIGRRQWRA